MAHTILASTTASISELKRNPMATVAAGDGAPVVIQVSSSETRTVAGKKSSGASKTLTL